VNHGLHTYCDKCGRSERKLVEM